MKDYSSRTSWCKSNMPYPVTTFNCKKCKASLVRKELVATTKNEITTNLDAKLAIKTNSKSNIVICGVCDEIVGTISRSNNTYTIFKEKSFEFTYHKL